MLIATMNTAREVKLKNFTRIGAELRRSKLIRFMCMPGVRPVITPASMPRSKAMIIWKIIPWKIKLMIYKLLLIIIGRLTEKKEILQRKK